MILVQNWCVIFISKETHRTGIGKSVSVFLRPSDVRSMKRFTRFANDIRWFGCVRVTNTTA
jgi:hypothetical protein